MFLFLVFYLFTCQLSEDISCNIYRIVCLSIVPVLLKGYLMTEMPKFCYCSPFSDQMIKCVLILIITDCGQWEKVVCKGDKPILLQEHTMVPYQVTEHQLSLSM